MGEHRVNLTSYGVRYKCDVCAEGEMLRDEDGNGSAIILTVNPPLFRHKCNKCGFVANLRDNYPTVRFEADSME